MTAAPTLAWMIALLQKDRYVEHFTHRHTATRRVGTGCLLRRPSSALIAGDLLPFMADYDFHADIAMAAADNPHPASLSVLLQEHHNPGR